MPRSDYEQIVSIEHDGTVVLDSHGGEYVTGSSSVSATASKHYHSSQRLRRAEQAPGLQTITEFFFRFFAPFPVIYVNDRIVEDDGTEWTVQHIRRYARTLQVDVERVV